MILRAEEMAQWLKSLAALPENLSSALPPTAGSEELLMTIVLGDLMASGFWLPQAPYHVHILIHTHTSCMHIMYAYSDIDIHITDK